jgi:hypothetical protein
MSKYRNDELENFMKLLEDDLTAIVGKELSNLDVMGILERNRRDNPEMSIEQAIMWAMREKAAIIMRKTMALATSLDRTLVMVRQMADHMENEKEAKLYLNRVKVLTNFNKLVKQML